MRFHRRHNHWEHVMADLTQALVDLGTAVTNLQNAPAGTDPRVAELEAQVADLTSQLAAKNAADDVAGDQVEAAVSAINAVVTPPAQ